MVIFYFSVTNPFLVDGAASNRLRGLLEFLNRSANVKVVQVNSENVFQYKDNFYTLPLHQISHQFKFLRFIPSGLKSEFLNTFIGRKSRREIFDLLSSMNPDIIWIDRSIALQSLVNSSVGRFGNAKIVLEISEFLDIHKSQKTKFLRSAIETFKSSYFIHRTLKNVDGLCIMTVALLDYFRKLPSAKKAKFCHLPMTVDLRRFKVVVSPPSAFKKPFILFVGVMNNIKDGVDILIESFAKISNDFQEHSLYLVGPWQPDITGHLEQIENLGLKNRVFWMKTYPRDIIPSIIGNAELLVLPRPDSKQAQGGFPTKLGEYLASGNPVCATAVGEIPDYLTDNESVFFAQPGSVDSFANAMRRALSEPELARLVGGNGRKVAEEEFNAGIQAKKLSTFFENLIEYTSND